MGPLAPFFAAILLIWNTIRTAMFARRREIEVMKLVGATNWFIRWPFILEGILCGLIGAVLGGAYFLRAAWRLARVAGTAQTIPAARASFRASLVRPSSA